MMTTMCALFGALPLALGTGDGAALRQPLGISIIGGLVLSQLLTLYTTPVVYVYLDRFRLWCRKQWRRTRIGAARRRRGDAAHNCHVPVTCGATPPERMGSMEPFAGAPGVAVASSPLMAIAVALALAGCKAGPDYVRPEVESPAAYRETPVDWKVGAPQRRRAPRQVVGGLRRSRS